MEQYHKIRTAYLRDKENNFKTLIEGKWAKPEFELLKDIDWVCTEKIDGTNIRIIWNGVYVQFKGKTNKAIIQPHLLSKLKQLFTEELMLKVFSDSDFVCLYGEGYGAKIQTGGNYLSSSVNFILFDIKIGTWWMTRERIEELAEQLSIKIVPIIGIWDLKTAIECVKDGFMSTIAENKKYMAEGLIMKPIIELFTRSGERIISKIKYKDFKK